MVEKLIDFINNLREMADKSYTVLLVPQDGKEMKTKNLEGHHWTVC